MDNKTIYGTPDECWIWIGSKDTAGYGMINIDHKLKRATHIAFELAYNINVPIDKILLHSCDNTACVNPKHLTLGNKKDNSADMKSKDRGRWLKHEQHPGSKLSKMDVTSIRSDYKRHKETFASIANKYKVNRTTISRIINSRNWV